MALALGSAQTYGAGPPIVSTTGSGQAGAQQSAANSNNMASMLGKAAGVLSMASGGLYMAKGAQELKCCMQGCNTGAGSESQAEKKAQEIKNTQNADCVKNPLACHPMRQPVDYRRLRFPTEARNSCPAPSILRAPFPMLWDFLRPAPARATGCLDGALALATGGLMMLNGMLGLAAASQAGQNGQVAASNAGNLGSADFANGTAPSPDGAGGPGTASLGGVSGSGTQIQLDPALLRTGTANNIMGQFENKFGIARDAFAQDVLGGQDPRRLLASAPRNPLSVADMNQAMQAAKNMSDADKEKALAGTDLSAAQRELAAQAGGAGTRAPAAKPDAPFHDGELEPVAAEEKPKAEAPLDPVGVSADVQAALLAKQLDASKKSEFDYGLFERVHAKYRQKAKAIFGYDPDGTMKGVGNADGF
jgi:hypothetical protein